MLSSPGWHAALAQDDLREALTILRTNNGIDNQTALRFKQKLAQHFREQLMLGAPTSADETGLRRLAGQLKARKVVVKLFLRHPLHAKLYLLFRPDPISPAVGYLGSSNLTFAGLSQQGELNIEGKRSYFPTRQPKTVIFTIDDNDPSDQYALLYSSPVVDAINALTLPRYGLGNYLKERPHEPPTNRRGSQDNR